MDSRLSRATSMFYASLPDQPQTGLRVSTSNSEQFSIMQVEQKLDRLINSVNYIQDQSDQAISLGDQAAHSIGDIVTHLDGFESRIQALETSTIINVPRRSATANSTRVPKELSVSVYI